MKKRIEWVRPTLVKLDASKTLGGSLPIQGENFVLTDINNPNVIIDRGFS